MIVKRLFDLFFSIIGTILLLPLFVIVAVAVKVESTGPIFFRQERVGQFGDLFRIIKFRTMVIDAEQRGPQVSTGDDQRITMVGKLIRKYKIDELPQLFNVILGQMSLVGPRPEVPRYVDLFKEDYEKILTVKPGITDIASLEFRDENKLLNGVVNPEEKYLTAILPVKIGYYHQYIRKQSLLTDFKLIVKTLLAIVR